MLRGVPWPSGCGTDLTLEIADAAFWVVVASLDRGCCPSGLNPMFCSSDRGTP